MTTTVFPRYSNPNLAPTGVHHFDDTRPSDDQVTVRGLLTQIGRERGYDPVLHAAALKLDWLSRLPAHGRTNRHEKPFGGGSS